MTVHFASKNGAISRGILGAAFVASLLGSAAPALALDAEAFAQKLNASFGMFAGEIKYDAATVDGDTVTLSAVSLSQPGQPDLEVGELVFEGVAETGDGGYTAELLGFDNFDSTNEDTQIQVQGLEISGVRIPADPSTVSMQQMLFYDAARVGPVTVTHKGAEVFSMAGAEGTVTEQPDGSAMDTIATASGIVISVDQIEDAKARDMFAGLGYDKLRGDVKMDVGWELATGRLDLREYAFTFNDVGRLNITMSISGYTMEFIQGLQQAQKAAATNPDPKAAEQAMGFAMMGMLQQLSFNGATVSFEDASLTDKALNYAGEQQGISGEQMAQALKGMMPLMLGQLGMPDLQAQVSAAASTFLDEPGSISISALPAQSVAVPMIMGAAMGDPRGLVDLLNVKVTANQSVETCCNP
ncbi:hypothetical protein [uncultured Hoeflea sp.]|uniref:hypothetical protein n=1 Tax=uncultured Hoeflea sp. TaxID=538666 RepID=UPI00263209E4|nr:hypothetical protein [uncultured Hoeflea sp.]